jgi:DNA-directed RNA polymerase subunit H (RpoH/RPB5)
MQPLEVVVYNIITEHFSKRMSLEFRDQPKTTDKILSEMERDQYLQINLYKSFVANDPFVANNPFVANDQRTTFLILKKDGQYSNHSPKIRDLMKRFSCDEDVKEKRQKELIVLVDKEFFSKKPLIDELKKYSYKLNIYDIRKFTFVVPDHVSVSPHRVLSKEEEEQLLFDLKATKESLPKILSNDSPVIWIGGVEGNIIEINRATRTSMNGLYYRVVIPYSL